MHSDFSGAVTKKLFEIIANRKLGPQLANARNLGILQSSPHSLACVTQYYLFTDGLTPLNYYLRKNAPTVAGGSIKIDMVSALLTLGADPNLGCDLGITPLMYACRLGRTETIQVRRRTWIDQEDHVSSLIRHNLGSTQRWS